MSERLDRIEKGIEELFIGIRELKESQKKTDVQLQRTEKELSKEIKNVNKMVGEMTGGLGKFVEGLVEPRAIRLAKSLNIKISEIHRRVKGFYSLNGTEEEREADIIIVGERNNK
ncbi:MAG: hypothetical protein AB1630_09275, partial [bacterium]